METKRVTINKSDGTSNYFDFSIPETAGTYAVKFAKEDGTVLNGGYIVVNGRANTYRLSFGMSDGTTIDAGIFTTPGVYTLSYPAMPTGVASYTITRNGSTLVSSPTASGTMTVYYGDTLVVTATPATGYNEPTISWNFLREV